MRGKGRQYAEKERKEMLCFRAKSGVSPQKGLSRDKTENRVKGDTGCQAREGVKPLFLGEWPQRRCGCDKGREDPVHAGVRPENQGGRRFSRIASSDSRWPHQDRLHSFPGDETRMRGHAP